MKPPSPPGHFLLGHLPALRDDHLGSYERWAREYGDLVALRMGRWPVYMASHPDLVKRVLVTDQRKYRKHRFFWRHVEAIFGDGLLTSEGDAWLHRRRIVQPAFHRRRVHDYGRVMATFAERMLDGWRDGEVRRLDEDFHALTLEIVAKVLFDADVESEVEEVGRRFDDATREISARFRRPIRLPDWVPTPGNLRYRRAVRKLDELVYRIIEEHRDGHPGPTGGEEGGGSAEREPGDVAGAAGDDLLTMLMQARDEEGRPLSDRALRDELVTLLLAGHETTALALSWTWWLLGEHPEAAEELYAEADRVLGDAPPGPGVVPRLEWTGKVVRESMRLRPPAYAFGREAVEDTELGGYPVPTGTTVFIAPWVLHRDPRWWEEPGAFRPGRWTEAMEADLPRHGYLPFGGGPRLCVGKPFAMMEAVLVLAAVARRFRLEPAMDRPPGLHTSITLRPEHGIRATVHRRR